MFSDSTSAGRSVVSARSIVITRSTVSGLIPCPVRMMVTSSSSIRSARATSAGSPRRVIWLPRTCRSASNAFSMSERCSSPGPSSATMLMLVGTTTTCWVPRAPPVTGVDGVGLADLSHGCLGGGGPSVRRCWRPQCYGGRGRALGLGDPGSPWAGLRAGSPAGCPGTSRRWCPRPRRRTCPAGPSKDGSRSRNRWVCRQVTLIVSSGLDASPARSACCPGCRSPTAGMSSIVARSGVPGLTSILIERPSRCMWPATPRMVSGFITVRVQDCTGPAFTGPHSRWSRSAVDPGPRRTAS